MPLRCGVVAVASFDARRLDIPFESSYLYAAMRRHSLLCSECGAIITKDAPQFFQILLSSCLDTVTGERVSFNKCTCTTKGGWIVLIMSQMSQYAKVAVCCTYVCLYINTYIYMCIYMCMYIYIYIYLLKRLAPLPPTSGTRGLDAWMPGCLSFCLPGGRFGMKWNHMLEAFDHRWCLLQCCGATWAPLE